MRVEKRNFSGRLISYWLRSHLSEMEEPFNCQVLNTLESGW